MQNLEDGLMQDLEKDIGDAFVQDLKDVAEDSIPKSEALSSGARERRRTGTMGFPPGYSRPLYVPWSPDEGALKRLRNSGMAFAVVSKGYPDEQKPVVTLAVVSLLKTRRARFPRALLPAVKK
jgi:hypothetical protein